MNKLTLILTFFVFCIGLSDSALGQKCTNDSTIIATFAGVTGQPPFSITSDGMGPYTNLKTRGTTTEVLFQTCNGSNDFTMNLASSNRTVKVLLSGGTASSSFLNFDRVANVPVTENSERFAAFCGGRTLDGSIILNTPNTTSADNYGGCGLDSGGYYVRRNVGFQLTAGHSLRFQNSPYDGGTLAVGTSYIKVYHATVSTWTLSVEDIPATIDPKCGINGSCGVVIYKPNNAPEVVDGYTLGRFQISLTSARLYP